MARRAQPLCGRGRRRPSGEKRDVRRKQTKFGGFFFFFYNDKRNRYVIIAGPCVVTRLSVFPSSVRPHTLATIRVRTATREIRSRRTVLRARRIIVYPLIVNERAATATTAARNRKPPFIIIILYRAISLLLFVRYKRRPRIEVGERGGGVNTL